MGYHLILRQSDGSITHRYAPLLEDMCEFSDLTPDTIIYQGEAHWEPAILDTVVEYRKYSQDWFRAGIKAQRLFKSQAVAERFIVEGISQDPESFDPYRKVAERRIKRGDFLIRNAGLEVEVKCLTRYQDHFYLTWADLQAHKGMESLTGTPVVFAIYERDGDCPKPDTLCMVSVAQILGENNKRVSYDRKRKCALIPVDLTTPGFSALSASPTAVG